MTDEDKKRILTGPRKAGKSADAAIAMIRARGQTKHMALIDDAHFFRGDLPGFLDERLIDEVAPPPTKKS